MAIPHNFKLLLFLISLFLFFLLLFLIYLYFYFKKVRSRNQLQNNSLESGFGYSPEPEELIGFEGGEELTVQEILDAPGKVVAKSGYGTLYQAGFGKSGSVMMLRFVRPGCCVGKREEVVGMVRVIGSVRHPNLVPLRALYVGPRGEKLFVEPFYEGGSLAHFLKDGKPESHRWEIIYKLSLGIARGLDHLHNGFQKPIIHGNLKSKNIFIDSDHQPRLSDFGLHLLLDPTSSQQMLESAASQGYKAPELIKMRDASRSTDIYSLGVIFLEILTRKEPTSLHLPGLLKNMVFDFDTFSSELSSESKNRNSGMEEGSLKFFRLAMACCSPSPVLRPDIEHVIRKLEEL